MSKSKGNVIYADDMADMFGVDAVRYFVLHEMPFETDGVISWELMVERFNSDLANTLGNLVKRTVSMTNQYFGGVLSNKGVEEEVDRDLYATVLSTRDTVQKDMSGLHVADALTHIFNLFKRCNKYIDETEPWVLAKDDAKKDRLSTVLYNLADCISIGAALLEPFLPDTAGKIFKELNSEKPEFEDLDKAGRIADCTKVTDAPETLFARVKVDDILKKVAELEKAQGAANAENQTKEAKKEANKVSKEESGKSEGKGTITIDDFDKCDFRVGEVLECSKVEKSEKLLCFKLKFGDEERQILSGIQKYYPEPEKLVGKKVMAVLNLKPRKMAGMISEGMLLSALDSKGNLALMTVEHDVESGAEVG